MLKSIHMDVANTDEQVHNIILGSRERERHLEKCIALSDTLTCITKQMHCFVLVN